MDLGITGCVALITGGSSGIGRTVAEELGRNGCMLDDGGRMEVYY